MSDAIREGLGVQPERRNLGKHGRTVRRRKGRREMGPCGSCGKSARPRASNLILYRGDGRRGAVQAAETAPPRRRLNCRAGDEPAPCGEKRHANSVPSARLATGQTHSEDDRRNQPPYFFSGSGFPCGAGCVNGNELNMVFAWFCICSCICTNMFFDCSI